MKVDRYAICTIVIMLVLTSILTVMITTSRPSSNGLQINVSNGPDNNSAASPFDLIINISSLHPENSSYHPYDELHYSSHPSLKVEILNVTNMSQPDYTMERVFNVRVLYSSDSNISTGSNYQLDIVEDMTGYFGMCGVTPKEFVNGTIVGIDDYNLDENLIVVVIGADPKNQQEWDNAWREKMGIIVP